jgi:acetyl-CoA decarbonylase/synthase complex subunit gamma
METMLAAMFVAKYGGIVVLSDFSRRSLFPLLLERLNIFTDPAAAHDRHRRYLPHQQPG